ncbi:MAG: hypothetical protein ACREO5_12000, partial [Candidatus Binatia bacterium]
LFKDLSTIGLQMLDVGLDLNDEERELLYSHGVLIDADSVSENPLFSCTLNEVTPSTSLDASAALIVNPTFHFVPFKFEGLADRLQGEHISARPSAWVADEVTEIERGYWFTEEQAEIVSRFEAGKPLPFDVAPDLLAKLFAAAIVTTQKDIDRRAEFNKAKLESAHKKYNTDKYAVVEELLPAEQMSAMRAYYRKYVANGFMPFEDGQSLRYYQHNEPLARVFHKNLTKLMCHVIGEEVVPSYVYAASYVEHADLKPHTDRPQCEFSISFQVDYQPEPDEHRSPWGLFLWKPDFGNDQPVEYFSHEFPAASQAEDTNPAVYLASGDGLIYKGRELIHYRYPLGSGHTSTSLFFHYVPRDFLGELR